MSRGPGLGCVAILALHAEKTSMDRRLGMAAGAGSWRPTEDTVGVAFLAFQGSMSALQREKIIMIEVAEAINAIMAVQACRTKLILVAGDEVCSSYRLSMATDANG